MDGRSSPLKPLTIGLIALSLLGAAALSLLVLEPGFLLAYRKLQELALDRPPHGAEAVPPAWALWSVRLLAWASGAGQLLAAVGLVVYAAAGGVRSRSPRPTSPGSKRKTRHVGGDSGQGAGR